VRLRVEPGEVVIDDLVAGSIRQDPAATGGDIVLRRSDGLVAYHLATVVDDDASGVTQVVRGDDLLPSTPRQVAIARALDLPSPAYAHVPLLLDPAGERLAKRRRSAELGELRASGAAPDRLVGALAWSVGLLDAPTPCRPTDLLEAFNLSTLRERVESATERDAAAATGQRAGERRARTRRLR
jgi:glutamyl-tRNA synthetase